MKKKISAMFLVAALAVSLAQTNPRALAAAGSSADSLVLAREDFGEYRLNGTFPADVRFVNFPAPGASLIDGGTGWDGGWGSNRQNFQPSFGSDIPAFLNVGGVGICYTYGSFLYRRLAKPIPLSVDHVLAFRFDLAAQSDSIESGVGLGLLDDTVRFGLTAEADHQPNRVAIYTNGRVSASEKEVPKGNSFYTFEGEIAVSAQGEDTLRLKAYPRGSAPPQAWDVETTHELGHAAVTYVGMLSNAYACLWANLSIETRNIAYGREVLAASPAQALTDLDTSTVWIPRGEEAGFAVDLGGRYAVSAVGMLFEGNFSGAQRIRLYGANDDTMAHRALLYEHEGPPAGAGWRADIPGGAGYRYLQVDLGGAAGDYGISEITVMGAYAPSAVLDAPVLTALGRRILDGGAADASCEQLTLKFDRPLDTRTLEHAVLLQNSRGEPLALTLRTQEQDTALQVVLKEALQSGEEYTLLLGGGVRGAGGEGQEHAFARRFTGDAGITLAFSTAGNQVSVTAENTRGIDTEGILIGALYRGGSLIQVLSSPKLPVPGGQAETVSLTMGLWQAGDEIRPFFIKDWASFSPRTVLGDVVNHISIDAPEEEGGVLTVRGSVTTADGAPLSGRDVLVAVTSLNQALPQNSGNHTGSILAIAKADTAAANGIGKWTASISLSHSLPGGMYHVYAASSFAPVRSMEFFYISPDRERLILQNLNSVTPGDTAAMTQFIMEHAEEIGISLSEKSANITGFSKVAAMMIGQGFQSAEAASRRLLHGLALENVNQAQSDAAQQAAFLNAAPDIGYALDRYDVLGKAVSGVPDGQPHQQAFWSKLFASVQADAPKSVEALLSLADRLLDGQLQLRHPIEAPGFFTGDRRVNLGQDIDVGIFSENAVSLNRFHAEAVFDGAALQESGVDFAPPFAGNAGKTGSAGKLVLTLGEGAVKNAHSLQTGACITLHFRPAQSRALSARVSVNIRAYRFDEVLNVERVFYTNLASDITVTSATSGGGGGGGGGAGSVIAPSPVIPLPGEPPKEAFTDLDGAAWARPAIAFLAEKKIVDGVGDGRFLPGQSVTREEFVKMLTLAFGLYSEDARCDFTDVRRDDWYYPYVASAVNLEIVRGVGGSEFGTGVPVTREQMAVFAYRTLVHLAPDVVLEETVAYEDADSLSDWARTAVGALTYAEVMQGSGGFFFPAGNTTRAMAAQVVYNMLKLFDDSIQ